MNTSLSQAPPRPGPGTSSNRRILGMIGLCFLCLQLACIWDPSAGKQGTIDGKPPMKLSARIQLKHDVHAGFIHQDTAFFCTESANKSKTGDTLYDLTAVNLKTQKASWTAEDTYCFFDSRDGYVFLVKEAPKDKKGWLLVHRALASGQILNQSLFGKRITPFKIRGPGQPLHKSEEPQLADDFRLESLYPTEIQQTGRYLLIYTHTHAWVFKRNSGQLIHEVGLPQSERRRQDVFAAAIEGDTLYTVAATNKPTGKATSLDPQFKLPESIIRQHVLNAIDLKTSQLIWQQKGLPYPLSHAQFKLRERSMMLILTTDFATTHKPDYHNGVSKHYKRTEEEKISTNLFYWLTHKGEKLWRTPWVLRHDEFGKRPTPASIVQFSTPDDRLFIHVQKTAYMLSLKEKNIKWRRPTMLSHPGTLQAYREGMLLYHTPGAAVLMNTKTGVEINFWSKGILPEPPQLASAPNTDKKKPKEIFATKHGCIRADGSRRNADIQQGSRPYYGSARSNGFFSVFCAKNLLELRSEIFGTTPPTKAELHKHNQYEHASEYAVWKTQAELPSGQPEFAFRYGNHVFTIINKFDLLAYKLPQ